VKAVEEEAEELLRIMLRIPHETRRKLHRRGERREGGGRGREGSIT
jgi:hypothetical protein